MGISRTHLSNEKLVNDFLTLYLSESKPTLKEAAKSLGLHHETALRIAQTRLAPEVYATEKRLRTLRANRAIGSKCPHIRMSGNGYIHVACHEHPRADAKGYVSEHILIVERAMGKYLRATAEVHHFNRKRNDNRNSNLVVCDSPAYHKSLHVRQAIKDAGGNPDTDGLCCSCGTTKPLEEFNKLSRAKLIGRNSICRSCVAGILAKYRAKRARSDGSHVDGI